jgi:hypothetical protein
MCNILKEVMDFQNDMRISKFLSIYKDELADDNFGNGVAKAAAQSSALKRRGSTLLSRSIMKKSDEKDTGLIEAFNRIFKDKKLDLQELS